MKCVGVVERKLTMTIDGYSNVKTINGAISDLGRYIAKHFSESEGNNLIEYKQECLMNPTNDCDYFLTVEEVPCASTWNDEAEEMEYTDANYYLCIRYVK